MGVFFFLINALVNMIFVYMYNDDIKLIYLL